MNDKLLDDIETDGEDQMKISEVESENENEEIEDNSQEGDANENDDQQLSWGDTSQCDRYHRATFEFTGNSGVKDEL